MGNKSKKKIKYRPVKKALLLLVFICFASCVWGADDTGIPVISMPSPISGFSPLLLPFPTTAQWQAADQLSSFFVLHVKSCFVSGISGVFPSTLSLMVWVGLLSAVILCLILLLRTQKNIKTYRSRCNELEAFFGNSPDLLCITDAKGFITRVNKEWEQTLGYAQSEWENQSIYELVHPQDKTATLGYFSESKKGDKTVEFQNRCQTQKGENLVLEWHVVYAQNSFFLSGRDITRQKNDNDKLRQTSLMLDMVLNTVPQCIFWKDQNSRYMGCNRVFAEAAGLNHPSEIVGKTDYDLPWSQEHTLKYLADDKKVIESKKAMIHIVEPLLQANGEEVWIDTTKIPLLDDKCQVIGLLGVFEDITMRKTSQEALMLTKERLDLAMAAANSGLWDWNLETNQVYFDDRYFTMAGYQPNDFPQSYKEWEKRVHPDDLQYCLKVVKDYLSGASSEYDFEFRFLRKDQTWMWIRGFGKDAGRNEDGQIIRLIGTHTDITKSKQMEKELAESHQMLLQVIDAIPMRVFWKDLQGNYLGCNKLFANDAGRSDPESLIGDNDFNMGWVDQAELYRRDDFEVMKSGKPRINYEEPQTTPKGDKIWLRTSKIPLKNTEGFIYGVLGTYEDIG